jgi:ferric-dicitrate binding protein FerR (iron transport regulator)
LTEPSDDARALVYDAVHQAWRRQVRRRLKRRQLAVAGGVFACAVLAVSAVLLRGHGAPRAALAEVLRVQGEVTVRADSGAAAPRALLAAGAHLQTGEVIETAPGSRLVLRRPGGATIHLAANSSASWQTTDALRLQRGVIYIDTDTADGGADALEIVTHTGRIRHVGTRYSVQVDELEVRVMVRDGAVSIGDSRASQRLDSGYAARIGADGRMTAATLRPGEGPWHWLAVETPSFVVEGRSLHAVLLDMAQAAGQPVSYASTAVEAESRDLLLHGPTLELDAEAAVDAVLLTTRFVRRPPLQIVPR